MSESSDIDNRIEGRLALITGASGGIGAACSKALYAQGCHVALTYSKNRESVEALVKELAESSNVKGGNSKAQRVTIHQADLGSVEEIAALLKDVQAKHQASVDILISNAGYGKRIVDILDIPLEEFEHTLNINLRASFLLVKGVVEAMKAQRWGRIIFVSSIAAYGAGVNGCHYAASKGGLMAMMKNLSSRLAEFNISVNDVAPAMIGDTGMIKDRSAISDVFLPLGRLGSTEEVANAVLMFSKTGYITGQSLVISGGLRKILLASLRFCNQSLSIQFRATWHGNRAWEIRIMIAIISDTHSKPRGVKSQYFIR